MKLIWLYFGEIVIFKVIIKNFVKLIGINVVEWFKIVNNLNIAWWPLLRKYMPSSKLFHSDSRILLFFNFTKKKKRNRVIGIQRKKWLKTVTGMYYLVYFKIFLFKKKLVKSNFCHLANFFECWRLLIGCTTESTNQKLYKFGFDVEVKKGSYITLHWKFPKQNEPETPATI